MPLPTAQTRVVELRTHGVMGTTTADLVGAVAAVDVAGDGVGRIVRPADRLLRPAPGPVLQSGGLSLPRTVEGYHWAGMTSGGWSKALWALLFPFSVINVAFWMLPPVPPGSRVARALGQAVRSLLRVSGLALTMLLVTQLAIISLDLLATSCLAPHSGCLAVIPAPVRALAPVRQLIGLLPPAVAVFVLYRISRVSWTVNAPTAAAPPAGHAPPLPGDNVVTDPDAPVLRALHLAAALAAVSVLALGGPLHAPANPTRWLWLAALLIVAGCLLATVLVEDRSGTGRHRVVTARLPRRVLLAGSAALLAAVAGMRSWHPGIAVGSAATIDALGVLFAASCLLLALLLVPAALLARQQWSTLPRRLRPWAGGWMAAPTAALAGLLGGGFGAGVGLAAHRGLASGLPLPGGYGDITLLWGVAGVLIVLAAVLIACAALLRRLAAGRRAAGLVRLLQGDRPRDIRRAATASWWAGWQRNHLHRALITLAVLLSAGAVAAAVLRVRGVTAPGWSTSLSMLSTFGVLVLALLAVGLLRVVYLAARKPTVARSLGVLADIASFWPREAHPVVPPCYALKAVPEIAARAAEHLRDPHTRVVLTGHSQGSLLAAVAAARLLPVLSPAHRERLGLVVTGSPLQWAYLRGFPAVVPFTALERLSGELGGRWRALCRLTDPLGGAVTTWERQVYGGELLGVGFRPGEPAGPLAAAVPGGTGTFVLGGDHWLPDPQHGPVTGRRWVPGVQRHHHYHADPEWDRAVAIAAGALLP